MSLEKKNRREFLKVTGTVAASALMAGHVAASQTDKAKEVPLSVDHPKGRTLNSIEESKSLVNEFHVFERIFSDNDDYPSVGLANIHAIVPGIEANKEKIIRCLEVFKERQANVAIFPEFCLTGYFWEDEKACREYMDKGVIENHLDWIEKSVKPLLDDNLRAVFLNNIRRGPQGKYYNSTFIITPTHDPMREQDIYDKVFPQLSQLIDSRK